jgi:hypothetical protein
VLHLKLVSPFVKDHFRFALIILFAQMKEKEEIPRIRECPTCERVFYAEDNRQKFCSSRCTKRETMRRLRARQTTGQKTGVRRKGVQKSPRKKKA